MEETLYYFADPIGDYPIVVLASSKEEACELARLAARTLLEMLEQGGSN